MRLPVRDQKNQEQLDKEESDGQITNQSGKIDMEELQ